MADASTAIFGPISTPTREPDPGPCPVCGDPVGAGESAGMVDGKLAHLHCWLRRRQEERSKKK